MAYSYKTGQDMAVKIDNAAGSVTDITAYVNQASLESAINKLDTTPIGATGPTNQQGMADVSIPLNFFVNSTTEGIFGPCINRTSVTKTAGFYNGIKWHTGEWRVYDAQFSGSKDDLIMGSCNLSIQGVVTRTSVAPT